MQPQRIIGIVLVVVGVVLLVMGLRATDAFASQVSKFFTGSPTDKAIWMTLGGIAATLVGAVMAVLPSRAAGR